MPAFHTSESGAVTVDWVVLTAALVGLGLATMGVVSQGVQDASGDVEQQLSSGDLITTAFYVPAKAALSIISQQTIASNQGCGMVDGSYTCGHMTYVDYTYAMDNGEEWVRRHRTTPANGPTWEETMGWTNADGETVAEDDWPDHADAA